jgi:hypothetical protein
MAHLIVLEMALSLMIDDVDYISYLQIASCAYSTGINP